MNTYYFNGRAVKATQWFKDGDHPDVRQFEWPGHICPVCGKEYVGHGFVGRIMTGRIVCPGDWIVTTYYGKPYVYSRDEFKDAVPVFAHQIPHVNRNRFI